MDGNLLDPVSYVSDIQEGRGKYHQNGPRNPQIWRTKVTKDANTGRLVGIAVHSIRDQHCGDDLVPPCANGGSNNRRDCPVTSRGFLSTHKENNQTYNSQGEAKVAEP